MADFNGRLFDPHGALVGGYPAETNSPTYGAGSMSVKTGNDVYAHMWMPLYTILPGYPAQIGHSPVILQSATPTVKTGLDTNGCLITIVDS